MRHSTVILGTLVTASLALGACSKSTTTPVTMVDAGSDQGADVRVADVAAPDLGAGPPDARAPDMPAPRTDIGFNEAVFIATHNSYSGGTRGTILEQLNGGASSIEFDVHADEFATQGYRIGHDEPGHEVELGGDNPDDLALSSWLGVVQDWRAANPDHLPLTIGIDIKDSLAARRSGDGSLSTLNAVIDAMFGDSLFTESDAAAGWPTVDEMRGRVLIVLSGDRSTRLAYRRTDGSEPAIARNATGIVVAHTAGDASRVWLGTPTELRVVEPTLGTDPAVALADDGTLVVFSVVMGQLQVRTGSVAADYAVTWDSDTAPFVDVETAANPSVQFVDATTVREIHDGPTGLKTWDGAWDATTRTITWASVASTGPRFDETVAGDLTASSDDTPPYGQPVIHLDDGTTRRRLRLVQRMWSESQFSGPPEFEADGVKVFASDAFGSEDVSWAEEKRAAGGLVRLWKFNLPNVRPTPPVNFPATDQPRFDWYIEYCRTVGCLTH